MTTIDEIAHQRRADPHALHRQLRGDLDWIVMKTLEKNRTRRYDTANGLAADIQRHLNDEPVVASPPAAGYRLRKFIRRNRAAVLVTGLVLLALLVGFAGAFIGFVRATRAKALAEVSAHKAELVTVFLEDMIGFADPHETKRPNLSMRDALDKAAATVNSGLGEQPEVEARIRHAIASAYYHLDDLDRAERHTRESLAIRERIFGAEHPDIAHNLRNLAWVLHDRQEYAEAERLCHQALSMLRSIHGVKHREIAMVLQVLGDLRRHQGDYVAAESLIHEASEMLRQVASEEDVAVAKNLDFRGSLYGDQGRWVEREAVYVEKLALLKRVKGESAPATLRAMSQLAGVYRDQQRLEEAETVLVDSLEKHRDILGYEHIDTIGTMDRLAEVYRDSGRLGEATALFAKALDIRKRVRGEGHADTLWNSRELADLYIQQGRTTEAEALLTEALEGYRRVLGEEDGQTVWAMRQLGDLYLREGRTDQETEAFLRHSVELHKRVLGNEQIDTLWAMRQLGDLYLQAGRTDEQAVTFLTQSLVLHRRALGEKHPNTLWTIKQLDETRKQQLASATEDFVVSDELREDLGLDAFYTKHIDAGGIPILASTAVADDALRAARHIVGHMLSARPELHEPLKQNNVRIAIIGSGEASTDIPEHRDLNEAFPETDWDQRTRGVGATRARPACSVGEENLLGLANDRYYGESILVHEFAHTMAELGIETLDPGFAARLQAAYDLAMEQGLWRDTYAATNAREYWAEGVQSWFDTNLEKQVADGQHNHVNTRAELRDYDPGLAKLIAEWLPDEDVRLRYPD